MPRGFWTTSGQHFVLFFIHKMSQVKLPRFCWEKIGQRFPSYWSQSAESQIGQHFPQVEANIRRTKLSKKVFGQNWAAFCPVFIHKASPTKLPQKYFLEKVGQHFPSCWSKWCQKGFGQNWAAFSPVVIHKMSQIKLTQIFLRKNGSVFLRLKPKCGEPNYPKRF